MGRFAKMPWHWWAVIMLLLAGFALFILNLTLDWQNAWISVGAPLLVLLGCAYNARMLWLASAPKDHTSK